MKIVGRFSFKEGEKAVGENFPQLLHEVESVIEMVDAHKCKTKTSQEKSKKGKVLFSPKKLNNAFKLAFQSLEGWEPIRVKCEYSSEYYISGYSRESIQGAFRELDFVKEKLGVEVQFGKYAFMVYNVCAKMTIFRNLGYITHGIEIVPVKSLAEEMSSGVSYFEQFVWDLKQRGESNIDIPVLILGIDV
jgi:hypothetical protein